ncbi:MAG: hypothetical protein ACTTKZ_02365 [Bacteroides sp.]
MHISIITPEQTVLTCDAVQVLVPGTRSPFAMLEHHQAIISSLVSGGQIKITRDDGSIIRVQIEGNSIVEQHENKISILATGAKVLQGE